MPLLEQCPRCKATSEEAASRMCRPNGDSCPMCEEGNEFKKIDDDGDITSFRGPYSYLSNFHRCEIELYAAPWAGTYPTVEHAYQAMKSQDPDYIAAVREAMTPGQAKRISKTITPAPGWRADRVMVMTALVEQKFTKHSALARALISTNPRRIIEGNDWGDRFWGMTKAPDGAWVGENKLGEIIMHVRARLLAKLEGGIK